MITRWEQWFTEDNLAKDARILSAPPSHSVHKAAQIFLERGVHFILDLACGTGRDTDYLASCGLDSIGVDAAYNGLQAAARIRSTQAGSLAWTNADARQLPFPAESFQGVYCYGLLHEFTGADQAGAVGRVMAEIKRILSPRGVLILTVLAGAPSTGLPHVQFFSREMFDQVTHGLHALEITEFDDTGCTGRTDYHVWYGAFQKS
jgi:ubiquinone/menaquinone biosynthesis C-methylase UbiE